MRRNRRIVLTKRLWIVLACQLLVGGVFVFSGLTKAIDPVGTAIKIGEYLQHFRMGWLSDFSAGFAWMQALAEIGLGIYILVGHHRLVTSLISLLFMGVMTPLTLYLAIFNPVDNCGCFGDAWILTNWETFAKNVVIL